MKRLQHPTEPPPETAPDCSGSDVGFGTKRRGGRGYLARSARSGPSVLVLHDWFGLRASTRAFADALCSEGFTALAPDLYGGRTAASVTDAQALADGTDAKEVASCLDEAAEHLRGNWHPRVGIVGFSLGAAFGMRLAERAGLEAAVVYYGIHDADASSWRTPLLGHFAEDDEWEPLPDVTRVFDRLETAGHDVELRVYPGAGHWFANADVPDAFDPDRARRAWEGTVEFLRYHLA